ncbi:MAG: hypothetical protein JNK23_19855 [Opitutaceae bacterium]|nr:hypothetical protein [Opitutaceae bacterium]
MPDLTHSPFLGRRIPRGSATRTAQEDRAAVLIVALIVSALIALGLASYLNLNLSSSRLSKRTFNSYAALNLAETGAEEAVWSFNRASAGANDAWTGWTSTGAPAWQKFGGFEFGGRTTGWVKVYVDDHAPGPTARPKIITQSSIGAPTDTPVTKMIEVTLRRRSAFANALVAKEGIVFSGTSTSLDAWNSDPDGNPLTPAVDYNFSLRTDRGSIATAAVVNSAMLLNDAHIWGFVATGGGQPDVGVNGSIRGADTPAGVMVDPRRIATDFNADFKPVTAPTDGTFLTNIPAVLGTVGTTTKWRAAQLVLSGNDSLTVLGDVTLVLTQSSGADAVRVTGNASINVPAGSRFTLYVEGGLLIAGRGLANANAQPIACQIWGTNTSNAGQSLHLAGNGALKAVIYAPNGDVQVNGNGDMMGSIVARNIRFTGNAAFHYDESLAYGQGNEPFSIAKWRELGTSDEQAPYLTLFQGW